LLVDSIWSRPLTVWVECAALFPKIILYNISRLFCWVGVWISCLFGTVWCFAECMCCEGWWISASEIVVWCMWTTICIRAWAWQRCCFREVAD
jgi:hypothetical protein